MITPPIIKKDKCLSKYETYHIIFFTNMILYESLKRFMLFVKRKKICSNDKIELLNWQNELWFSIVKVDKNVQF
jgi:hypothetical protein